MATDLAAVSACDLIRLYRRRAASPVEVTRAVLARIERFNDVVNAFCLVDAEAALADAARSEARWRAGEPVGLVDGVPATVKDLVLARGWPTLRGSLTVTRDQPWNEDAPATARLRAHGAVLLGKTTTPEFGWKAVTDSPLTGLTRNPWDTAKTPGGSSGGAAVAAALGMGALHVGTDGGGSIRIPGGFTGIVGLKPSFGRVPAYPLSPMGTLSHIGPMTRSVEDAALMLSVIAGFDARDWYALPTDGRDYRIGLGEAVAGLRIAYSRDLGYVAVAPEVAALVDRAVAVFADLGADVEPVDPGFADPKAVFRTLWYAGAAAMARGFSAEQRRRLDPGLLAIITEGERLDLPAYMDAVALRRALGAQMRAFHETYDLLLLPTLPVAAFPVGQEVPEPAPDSRWIDWAGFMYPFNLTQQPAITVPCGFTASGLPAGLQIVGPMHADALVLRAARAFEGVHPFPMPRSPRTGADGYAD